ncbi:MAG: glycosyltransferase family 2 protein, partial [Ktedonobacteraceae bacterium]
MLVLQALRWLLLSIEIVIALPILYLCIVSVSAFLATKKRKDTLGVSSTVISIASIAILIPAHNEIAVLGKLLESLADLEYPKDHFDIYVVADNCTDTTAELAQASDWVHVYERFDQSKRGKGFALNWLMQKLHEDHLIYDAYIVLDADSVVYPNFLDEMNKGLAHGVRALQAQNNVLNITDSPSTALRWLALTLMNHVRPLGRNGLGCSSTLTGNGMCLSHALLERYPWQSFSLAEDYQYYLNLVKHGEKVRYMPDAIVRSEMPSTFAHMRTQDIRWESPDKSQPAWKTSLQLLKPGVKKRDFVRIEAIAELLTPPLSYLIGWSMLALFGS